jgi:hypothetical protein
MQPAGSYDCRRSAGRDDLRVVPNFLKAFARSLGYVYLSFSSATPTMLPVSKSIVASNVPFFSIARRSGPCDREINEAAGGRAQSRHPKAPAIQDGPMPGRGGEGFRLLVARLTHRRRHRVILCGSPRTKRPVVCAPPALIQGLRFPVVPNSRRFSLPNEPFTATKKSARPSRSRLCFGSDLTSDF